MIRITEIFLSIQGESTSVGIPTVFVRLTGCPLRCTYCDTAYAFSGGSNMSVADIVAAVASHGVNAVTVTGGEPLAQRECLDLCRELCDLGYAVSIETSGALPVEALDDRVRKVMDLKTPSSGECERNLLDNIGYLGGNDEVKFVISDREDYEWVRTILNDHAFGATEILLSPSHDVLNPATLAQWMLEDRLTARLQLQVHKYLWGDVPGR